MAVTSFVSSSEMSMADTCCVRLARLAAMTSSALPYLAGFSLYTTSLSTYASALMTRSDELALCVWLIKRSLAYRTPCSESVRDVCAAL